MGSSMDDDETRVQRRENPLNTYATASRLLAEDTLADIATIQLGRALRRRAFCRQPVRALVFIRQGF